MEPSPELSQFGWTVDPESDGGVRIRRSGEWRAGAVGCSFGVLILFVPLVMVAWHVALGFLYMPKVDWVWILYLLIPLGVLSFFSLIIAAAVWQFLVLLVVREQWEASPNCLRVRRRVLGLTTTREYSHAELLLDPKYGSDKRDAGWRILILANGRRRCLFGKPALSVTIGSTSLGDDASRAETQAIIDVLARHSGWPVHEGQAKSIKAPPTERRELPAVLRKRGFSGGLNARLRTVLRPPRRGKYLGTLILMAFGGWTFFIAAMAVSSWVRDAIAAERPVMDPMFWVLVTPLVLIGGVPTLLGLMVLLSRELWTLDHNLLIVTSGLLGWKSEQQYVDGRLVLARVGVHHKGEDGAYTTWEWQLQLKSPGEQPDRVLDRHTDDDSPRALGGLLANATGWPLSAAA